MNLNVAGINQTQNVDNNMVSGQGVGSQINIPVSGTLSPSQAGINLLLHLNTGDVFTGEITNITNNQITIALSDGASVTATLADALSYNIGDTASFSIKDNSGEQIILKSVNRENIKDLMNDQTIRGAIQNAGLAVNDTTVSLVHNLMKQGQPIDANTLNNYVRMLEGSVNATPEDVVLMTKMGIPVTDENVAALHDYYDFSEGITGKALDISENLYNIINELADASPEEISEFVKSFTSSFGETVSLPESLGQAFSNEALEALAKNIQEFSGEAVENDGTSQGAVSDSTKALIDGLSAKVSDGSITAKEFLNEFAELAAKSDIDRGTLKQFTGSETFKKITQNMVRQELFLRPEDVNSDSIKRMYAKVINDSGSMAEKFAGDSKMTPLLNNMNSISNDVQFLNDLNQFMAFVQIPLKMTGQNAHGDLYVYSKKRSASQNNDELKALLHLDMDNLGPMDIFVTMHKQNVSTDFKVASDDILDYIQEHMDELTARLNKLGYTVSNTVQVSGKDYGFKPSVIENELPPAVIKRYSFDVRA